KAVRVLRARNLALGSIAGWTKQSRSCGTEIFLKVRAHRNPEPIEKFRVSTPTTRCETFPVCQFVRKCALQNNLSVLAADSQATVPGDSCQNRREMLRTQEQRPPLLLQERLPDAN